MQYDVISIGGGCWSAAPTCLSPPSPTEAQRQAVARAARRLDAQRRNVCRPKGSYCRSMTALYNENPLWLRTAHAELDAAAAYGWPADVTDREILQRLARLNRSGRAGGRDGYEKVTDTTPPSQASTAI